MIRPKHIYCFVMIPTCFMCTFLHFLAFYGSNLLTKCQFLFSVVFVFQKSCTWNFLGIGWNKRPESYFSGTKTEPKGHKQESCHMAVHRVGVAPPLVAPGPCTGASSPCLLRPSAYLFLVPGKPQGPDPPSTKSFDAAVNWNPSSGGFCSPSRHPAGEGNHRRRPLYRHVFIRGDGSMAILSLLCFMYRYCELPNMIKIIYL
jgi:hypothetical protein